MGDVGYLFMAELKLRCPNCYTPLTNLACPNGHTYRVRAGVLELLEDAFGKKLHAFTTQFSQIREQEGRRLTDPAVYEQLPHIKDIRGERQWRVRRYDLAVVRKLLEGQKALHILEIGAWNGWLSHHLVQMGHQVTAVDYFADEYDGLGAKKFYSANWQAIQMDIIDLSIIHHQFDVILLNRCLQFFTSPHIYLQQVRQKLSPGGKLIITGLYIFQNPREKARNVENFRQTYRTQYNLEIFIRPTRGYLDSADKMQLQAQGVTLHQYPQLRLVNLLSKIIKTRPTRYYGIL